MKSVWLTVEDVARTKLCKHVETLAAERNAPVFEPHITLVGDVDAELDGLVAKCEGLFQGRFDGTASVAGVDGTDQPFMSLFLDINLNGTIVERRDQLYSRLMGCEPPAFRPHISLAYDYQRCENRGAVITQLADIFSGYTFNISKMEIWESDKITPIDRWQRLWSRDLSR